MRRPAHSTYPGFTLVETLVVLVIMSVFTGVLVLAWQQVGSTEARQQQSNMVSWLNHLADTAVLEGGVYGVTLDGDRLLPRVWYRDEWRDFLGHEPLVVERGRFEFIPELGSDIPSRSLFSSDTDGAAQEPALVLLPTGMAVPAGQLRLWAEDDSSLVVSWNFEDRFAVEALGDAL